MTTQDIISSVIASVSAAPIVEHPFSHIITSACFQVEAYREMQDNLPADDAYSIMKNADTVLGADKKARLRFGFTPIEMRKLTEKQLPVWSTIRDALSSVALETVMREKFRAALEGRFGAGVHFTLQPVLELMRDSPGYEIGIHTDIPFKVMTLQFYLPADESLSDLGTTYYEKRGEEFIKTGRNKFLPNTGHAFVVNDHSWHSATELDIPRDVKRNSLMLLYYLKAKGE
jgi:hypothetical protein